MPVTPGKDKNVFWRLIRSDPEIQRLMGLEGSGDETAAQHIVKQREVQEPLAATSRYICIFDAPSAKAAEPYIQSIMQIDVLMPAERQHIADETLERIIAILGRACISGRALTFEAQLGNIASAYGFYRCGARFSYYSSKGRLSGNFGFTK